MTINMLRAISKMLDKDSKLHPNVECAKLMLDEVIKGLEADPNIITFPISAEVIQVPLVKDGPEPTKPKKPEPRPKGSYRVVVDASRKITKIEGLDLEADVTLDGKKMKHKDAIGKTFEKVVLP